MDNIKYHNCEELSDRQKIKINEEGAWLIGQICNTKYMLLINYCPYCGKKL